jgi:uncharacterized Ntn-hydrolase superfamily protein
MKEHSNRFPLERHPKDVRSKASDKHLCLKMAKEHGFNARTIDDAALLVLNRMQERRERQSDYNDQIEVKIEEDRTELRRLRQKWSATFDEGMRWKRAADLIFKTPRKEQA